jgi:hypothetical protein
MTTEMLKGTEEFLNKSYAAQRKDRMQDCIDDYLQDGKVPARQTYEEMLSCINDVMEYHKNSYCRASELYDLLQGLRQVNLGETSLEKELNYDKLPKRY